MPRLTLAIVVVVLAALASTMTYTGFLVVGVLADYLGTGRFIAGLLLGGLFARFPWISKGKLRIVGLLPAPFRRPLILGILALCLATFVVRGDHVPAAFTDFAAAFLLAFPWLKRALFGRLSALFARFTGKNASPGTDDTVIDGEFREQKNDRLIDR